MKKELKQLTLRSLRDNGTIVETETAYTMGDLVIAECVITGAKRVLGDVVKILNESPVKQILKG